MHVFNKRFYSLFEDPGGICFTRKYLFFDNLARQIGKSHPSFSTHARDAEPKAKKLDLKISTEK